MILNNNKYYKISFELDGKTFHVGYLELNNKEVKITKGIPFFFCQKTYCFDFFLLPDFIYKFYFELVNGKIKIINKLVFNLLELKNSLNKEEFEPPKIINKIVYKWNINVAGITNSILISNDGIVKALQEVFILETSYVNKSVIYKMKFKCGNNFLVCQITCNKKPFITSNNKELYIIENSNYNCYEVHYKANRIIIFRLNSNNTMEIVGQLSLYYNGIYWIKYNDDESFFLSFKIQQFELEFQEYKIANLDYKSSTEEILEDFQNSPYPIILKNTEEMPKYYNIYYYNKKMASIFINKKKIRSTNYLFYNGIIHRLFFSENKSLLVENELESNKSLLECSKSSLECQFIYIHGRLIILTENFSSILSSMGAMPLREFYNLSKKNKNNKVL